MKKEEKGPFYTLENVMQMGPQDIQNILETAKFPVGAALNRLSELRISWSVFNPKNKRNLLHCAAEQGDCESINRLLHYKIYPIDARTENEIGGLRLSALNFACENNHFEAVKLLVKNGANVNGGSGGYKPILFSAIKGGNMEIFEFLVQSGANVNVTDIYRRTCLFEAVYCGKNDFIDKFLQMGQNPMLVVEFRHTLLFEACLNPNFETLKKIMEKFHLDPYAYDALRYRPIDHLIGRGDRATLDLFVSRGIKIFGPNRLLCSPLYLACLSDNLETSQYMLERGVNPNIHESINREYPIHAAVKNKNVQMVQLLVRFGASIHVSSLSGDTPITMAVKSDSAEIIELLVRLGADINDRKAFSLTTPLHTAAGYSSAEVINKIIDLGGCLNSLDQDKMTPLHKACASERPQAAYALIQRGANVNAVGLMGKKPLDLTQHPDIMRMLMERGATKQSALNSFMYMCCCCFVD